MIRDLGIVLNNDNIIKIYQDCKIIDILKQIFRY